MNETHPVRPRVLIPVLLILVILNLALLARLLWPVLNPTTNASPAAAALVSSGTPLPEPQTPLTTQVPPVFTTAQPGGQTQDALSQQGVMVLSMRDGTFYHLFAYHPLFLPLSRITHSKWDDINPSVSPDGTRIAYSSHMSGVWDLYMLDLRNGKVTRLTDTPDYDGKPTWSPDGEWLCYESYHNNNLDLFLLSVSDLSQSPIQLTDDPGPDFAPAWSVQGRQVAFVSTRSGDEDIWLAKLDDTAHRFTNLSRNSKAPQTSPAWSPDGRYLTWTTLIDGISRVEVWDSQNKDQPPVVKGYGQGAIWDPTGRALLSPMVAPNQYGLNAYDPNYGLLAMPFLPLPGKVAGIDWKSGKFPNLLIPRLDQAAAATQPPLYEPTLSKFPIEPVGRLGVVPINDVQAPFPMLQDGVDESFRTLRQTVAEETGWDALGNLENAFIPLTQPSVPGLGENWLYTGRAFATNSLLIHAGWMQIVKEDIEGQTYWRVYLKARFQDGSQGKPMNERPWDLNARYNGDPKVYEQGGQYEEIPPGYWIDFTEIAGRYGWERLPALVNWISYYPAARFNQFVMSEGRDWRSAMLEIYPPEVLSDAPVILAPSEADDPQANLTPEAANATPTSAP